MKTLSILVVMLTMAFTTFARVPEGNFFQSGKPVVVEKTSVNLPTLFITAEPRECSVSMSATVVVGSVQCVINVTATGATCAEATTSAISQMGDAKKAIQEALQ